MVQRTLRLVLCAVVGLLAGRLLGPLLVPDPTGTLATALTIVLAVAVGGGLYATDWLRESNGAA